jgi:hypothetical protein
MQKKNQTANKILVTLVGSLVAGLVGRWTKQSHVRAPPNMTHHLHQHEATTADVNTTTNTNRSKSRKKVLPNQLGRYNPLVLKKTNYPVYHPPSIDNSSYRRYQPPFRRSERRIFRVGLLSGRVIDGIPHGVKSSKSMHMKSGKLID